MRKIVLISALLLTTNAFGKELSSFEEIKAAAAQGEHIHIAVDFSQCRALQKSPAMNNIGVFTPETLQITQHAIVTSFTHFTLNSPTLPNRPTIEFIKYRIDNRNIVNVTMQTLDATNYARLGETMGWSCPLATAAKIYNG